MCRECPPVCSLTVIRQGIFIVQMTWLIQGRLTTTIIFVSRWGSILWTAYWTLDRKYAYFQNTLWTQFVSERPRELWRQQTGLPFPYLARWRSRCLLDGSQRESLPWSHSMSASPCLALTSWSKTRSFVTLGSPHSWSLIQHIHCVLVPISINGAEGSFYKRACRFRPDLSPFYTLRWLYSFFYIHVSTIAHNV